MGKLAHRAGARLAVLRRRIAALEGRPALPQGLDSTPSAEIVREGAEGGSSAPTGPKAGLLPLGFATLDRVLGGGLARAALHEVRSAETRAAGAAHGFATALLARLAEANPKPILWVSESSAHRETGLPYGPGLIRFGLDPGRILIVTVDSAEAALWVFEEGLRCAGLAAVLAEIQGNPKVLDLTAARRLALRARDGGVTGLLLRQGGAAESGTALTRWLVTPQPAAVDQFSFGIGLPAWRLFLERNRLGPTGAFDVEWNHATRAFAAPAVRPTLPVALPAFSRDRPDRAARLGQELAFDRTG